MHHSSSRALFLIAVMLWPVAQSSAALFTVSTTNDSGAGSLRQAINDSRSGDTIRFAVTGTIVLTNGELVIATNLTITGPGASLLTLSGNFASRVFSIISGAVEISGLTICHGVAAVGAGISNDGMLMLMNCVISENFAVGSSDGFPGAYGGVAAGGAIWNGGTLLLVNCSVLSNSVRGGNGAGGSGYFGPVFAGGGGGPGKWGRHF